MAPQNLEQDLRYVRDVVERADAARAVAPIFYLWAVISLVGFPLLDLDPEWGGRFWPIAGPLGGLISFVLGWRAALKVGQGSSRDGLRHALHWSGMFATILLAVMLQTRESISAEGVMLMVMLILAFGWYTGGLYLGRPLVWVGLAFFACYALLLIFDAMPYRWTATGVILAASMVISGLVGSRRGAVRA